MYNQLRPTKEYTVRHTSKLRVKKIGRLKMTTKVLPPGKSKPTIKLSKEAHGQIKRMTPGVRKEPWKK